MKISELLRYSAVGWLIETNLTTSTILVDVTILLMVEAIRVFIWRPTNYKTKLRHNDNFVSWKVVFLDCLPKNYL